MLHNITLVREKKSMSRVLDVDPYPRNSLWDESSDTLKTARSDMAVGTWEQGSLPVGRVKKHTRAHGTRHMCTQISVCAKHISTSCEQVSVPNFPSSPSSCCLLGNLGPILSWSLELKDFKLLVLICWTLFSSWQGCPRKWNLVPVKRGALVFTLEIYWYFVLFTYKAVRLIYAFLAPDNLLTCTWWLSVIEHSLPETWFLFNT